MNSNSDEIFHELKESEDERIRKAISDILLIDSDEIREILDTNNVLMQDIVAWLEKQGDANKEYWTGYREGKQEILDKYAELEKQGEQKPYGQREECSDCQFNYAGECKGSCSMKRGEQKSADKVEPKFHEGEWINGYYTNYKVLSVNNDGYVVEDVDGNKINILFENEKFHHLWTIQDAKEGDVLVSTWKGHSYIYIFKEIESNAIVSYIYYYPELDAIDVGVINMDNTPTIPATKEQRNLLFQKMKEAGYVWDVEKKELKKIINEKQIKQNLQDNSFRRMFEQKSTDKVEPKFHQGEWIVHHGTDNIYQVVARIDNQYQLKYGDNYTVQKCADVDRCARLWDIAKDAKKGDVLFYRGNVKYSDGIKFDRILLFENLDTSFFVLTKYSNGIEDYGINENIDYPDNIIPATKEQKEILFMVMKEVGYEWDSKHKQLKKN